MMNLFPSFTSNLHHIFIYSPFFQLISILSFNLNDSPILPQIMRSFLFFSYKNIDLLTMVIIIWTEHLHDGSLGSRDLVRLACNTERLIGAIGSVRLLDDDQLDAKLLRHSFDGLTAFANDQTTLVSGHFELHNFNVVALKNNAAWVTTVTAQG